MYVEYGDVGCRCWSALTSCQDRSIVQYVRSRRRQRSFFVHVIVGIVVVEIGHIGSLCRVDVGLAVVVVGGVGLARLTLLFVGVVVV